MGEGLGSHLWVNAVELKFSKKREQCVISVI